MLRRFVFNAGGRGAQEAWQFLELPGGSLGNLVLLEMFGAVVRMCVPGRDKAGPLRFESGSGGQLQARCCAVLRKTDR